MKYIVSAPQPHTHFIEIELVVQNTAEVVHFQLPAWRPGRYELGNFAKNVKKWSVFDGKGAPLPFKKITKDCWEVQAAGAAELHVKYNYYAYQMDAGSCWLDETQLYVNGVHCFMYVPEHRHEPCQLELKVPDDYKVATGLTKVTEHSFTASDYDELIDCPFIASNTLQHNCFVLDNVLFHLWFQGECKPSWSRIINDFFLFVHEQAFETMREFPTQEYHFIYQIVPYKAYHGVEHLNSTVILLGPGYDLMKEELYTEFISVSSHELFHAWNIKTIRPAEMMPYDYTRENYSRLGYVCEGATTYYGDLMLFRSRVFSFEQYAKELGNYLQRHFDNFGRLNLSVADSSFDTWLDGYTEGVPGRKSSIYVEGCLTALMTDILIRKHSGNKCSLDDVMRALYNDFGKRKIGYKDKDYMALADRFAGEPMAGFFRDYVYGVKPFDQKLKELIGLAGMDLVKSPSKIYYEDRLGFKAQVKEGRTRITAVAPRSAADKAGLAKDDEVISINGMQVLGDLAEWSSYYEGQPVKLSLFRSKKQCELELVPGKERYYHKYSIKKTTIATEEQKAFFKAWSKQTFDIVEP